MGYLSSKQISKELNYLRMTRIKKQHYKIRIDFKDVKNIFKTVVKEFHKAKNRNYDKEKIIQRLYLDYIEATIDHAHAHLFHEIKTKIMDVLQHGPEYFVQIALHIYSLQKSYKIKPPRTIKTFIFFKKRAIPSYQYMPKLFYKTESFFNRLTHIVHHYRYRIFYKNGRVKTGALRSFYSKIYQFFVEEGHLSDVEIKKPMNASFQSNGGVYAWEANDKVIYIGRTQNFHNRFKQHIDCFKKGCKEKKYTSGVTSSDITIRLLAITNNKAAQKVLETVFFHKYKPTLNMIGTLRMDRILSQKNYNEIFQETLRSETHIHEDEDEAFMRLRETLNQHFVNRLDSYKKTLIYT